MAMITRTTEDGELSLKSISQDLDAAYESINRQDAQLDSFNQRLAISGRLTMTIAWDGGNTNSGLDGFYQASLSHTLGYAPIFLAYYHWSQDPAGVWYPLDDIRFNSSGVVQWQLVSTSTSDTIYASLFAYQAGVASTFTVTYFLLKEPAQSS